MKWIALLLALFTAGCAEAHPPIRDVALRLDLSPGICSATAVGPDLILTATHCMEGNRITAINGQPAYALKRIDDGKDHSLVRVSIKFKRWAKAGKAPLIAGDRVKWLGNPAGNENVYREGYVSRSYTDEIWLDAQAYGGDSGAGVYGPDGRLCGVISAGKAWNRGIFIFNMTVMYPMAFTAKQWKDIR